MNDESKTNDAKKWRHLQVVASNQIRLCFYLMDLDCTLRIRGLPWQATVEDIVKFFDGCAIKGGKEGVTIILTGEGRPSGEALVEMESEEEVEKGLEFHKKHMGSRYIEVFNAQPHDLEKVNHPPNGNGFSGGEVLDGGFVRLRGLPFGCRRQEIEQFFEGLDIPRDGIVLPMDHMGRSSGEAYVKFVSREQAEKAMEKHKEKIGHRYIEIFKSSAQEFRQVSFDVPYPSHMNGNGNNFPPYPSGPPYAHKMRYHPRPTPYDRFMDGPPRFGGYGMAGPPHAPPSRRPPEWDDPFARARPAAFSSRFPEHPPMFQQRPRHLVHMRGIPFKASQIDVHEFFRPLQPINIQILMDESGRSSGEADVEFATHEEAVRAMNKDKANMQHRYIELFLDSEPTPIPPPAFQPPPHPAHLQAQYRTHPPALPPRPPLPMAQPSIPHPPLFGGMRNYHSNVNGASGAFPALYGSSVNRLADTGTLLDEYLRSRI